MKKIISAALFIGVLCTSVTGYAAIHFDVEKVIREDKYVYDTKDGILYSRGYTYDWSKDDDIPTIDSMPEPNVKIMNNGYITKINGQYYWAGRTGAQYSTPLPIVELGNALQEGYEKYSSDYDYVPDLFPYNANDEVRYEVEAFGDKSNISSYMPYGKNIGKWVFRWDGDNTTYVFVDGINSVKTDLTFKIIGQREDPGTDVEDIMFWEDDTKFYIRNCNILISTDKESFYAAMEELEAAPKVRYQDTYLAFEQAPVIQDDRTLIPIRFLFEQMGATVDWNGDTRTATIAQNGRTITFSIDNTTAMVNGQPIQMDVPARIINDKTLVPLRFLSESLGYTVNWDGDNRIVTIE